MNDELIRIYHPELPPLLAELAETPELLRLKEVGMNCGCEYTAFPRFARSGSYSRWVHSLGVGLIVWHFTGDPAQAAAGLLHDIATPTFAHVVDFLRGDYLLQEATEDGTRDRIAGSPQIQALLSRYGLSTDAVCDYHRYPVADNDSPRLSADRLEYSLGNAIRWDYLTPDEAAAIYGDLRIGCNEEGAPELVFGSRALALRFADAALECARIYVCDADRCAMQRLSELLAKALEWGILSPADLDGTEPPLIAKLEGSALEAEWCRFRAMNRTLRAVTPPDDRPWRQIPAKKRRIDPFVEGQGRVSLLDAFFSQRLDAFMRQGQTEWLLAEDALHPIRFQDEKQAF